MQITPEQCRAARGLLDWGQPVLIKKTGLDRKTISKFERGKHIKPETIELIYEALAASGVVFLEAKSGEYQPTVALRFDYVKPEPEVEDGKEDEDEESEEEKKKRLGDYWEGKPEGLAMISEKGRSDFADSLKEEGSAGDFLERAAE